MITTVLFDLDETLLDDERTAILAQGLTSEWAKRHLPGIDTRRLQDAYHHANISFWKTYDQAKEKRTGEELRRDFWLEGLRACGIDDPDFAETLAQEFEIQREKTYEMFPDAVPCLDALKGRYKLGLVSNGASSIQGRKVRALELERWMDTVVIAEDVGVSKPDRRIFDVALERIGCTASEAAMVGDLLERDIQGSENAGILPIWIDRSPIPGEEGEHDVIPATYRVNRSSHVPPPEHVIRSLAELPPLLKRLNAAG